MVSSPYSAIGGRTVVAEITVCHVSGSRPVGEAPPVTALVSVPNGPVVTQ
jgi:hypothetical protein